MLSDDFTGTDIAAEKWVEYDAAGAGGSSGNIQQNGTLSISNSNNGTTALVSVDTFSSDTLEISATVSQGGKFILGYGDQQWAASSKKAYLAYSDGGTMLGLVWNNSALKNNVSCGSYTSGATYKMKLLETGFQIYKNGSLQCEVTPASGDLIDNYPIFLESNDSPASLFDDLLVSNSSSSNSAPNPPTNVIATGGDTQATVTFTPGSNNGSEITGYTVTSSPGNLVVTGSASPITVTGLTNGIAYTFTVTATNAFGTSNPSSASNAVTPNADVVDVFDSASLWFKADAITGLSDGALVASWEDSSSSGLSASQASGGMKPTYKTGIVNSSWPIVRFDGGDVLITGSTAASSDITLFTVVRSANTTSGYFAGFGGLNNALIQGFTANKWEYFSSPRTVLGDISTSNFQIITSRVGSSISGGISLGADSGLLAPWAGDVAEFLLFKSDLSDNDYNTVYNYLSAKYFSEDVPDAPIIGGAIGGDTQATVAFTPGSSNGYMTTSYTVTSAPGNIVATGSASPITVTGLTNGTAYTFTVTATNAIGTSEPSSASNTVTPQVPSPLPNQVEGIEATGVNKQVLLAWDEPDFNSSAITDYIIEYKRSSDSDWSIFDDEASTSLKGIVTGLVNGVEYSFRVSAVNTSGSGAVSEIITATPRSLNELVFVFNGESNAGGQALNSEATLDELASTPEVQILNNTSFEFENLDIGTNNNIDHCCWLYSSIQHGFELGLANNVKDNIFPDNPQIHLVKTGQGGSTLDQWNTGGNYWTKFLQRIDAAKTQLSENRQWVVWLSIGINDYISGTTAADYKSKLIAHINKIKTELPGTIIILTQFQAMSANSGYPTFNAAMEQIADTESNVFVVDSTGADLDDGNHWSYDGLKSVGDRMITITNNQLGLIYPGIPTSLAATPLSTSVELSWTAPVSNGGASITDYLIEYKTSVASSWTTFSDGISTATSATVTGISGSTLYNFRVSAVNANGAGNVASINATTASTDGVAPIPSAILATASDTTTVVTWTTNELSSSIVDYGFTIDYGLTTAETNTVTRVYDHSVELSELFPCTSYHFRVRSKDAALNTGVSADSNFTTTGCSGSAPVEETVSESVATSTGATIDLNTGDANLSLTIPPGFDENGDNDVVFQLQQLATNALLAVIGSPTSRAVVGTHTYNLSAFSDATTALTTFDQPLTLTITYTDGELGALAESSLAVYYWDGDSWEALDSCTVVSANNTVSCTTTHFTTFGVFGSVAATIPTTSRGGSGAGGGCYQCYNNPSIPSGGFRMSINGGVYETSNRNVFLGFNAGADIKKMSISMTGDFTDASQENYAAFKPWDLCSKFGGAVKNPTCPDGKYTVYAKFYTAYGKSSDASIASSTVTLKSGAISVEKLQPYIHLSFTNPFTKYLQYGQTNADVKRLQVFLNSDPDTRIAGTGAGSPGKETNYFGYLTHKAVINFQEKYAKDILTPWGFIKGTGYVGKTTLSKINELISK